VAARALICLAPSTMPDGRRPACERVVAPRQDRACQNRGVALRTVHKHVGDAKERDAEASAKAQAADEARRDEAVEAQAHCRHRVDDGKPVVVLPERSANGR
jgi:hypothetical protein